MSNEPEAPAEPERQRLRNGATLARFALVGATLAAVVGTFAYIGGWFTPHDLTPARLTDAFEHADGVHPGFRRNHAKGLGVSGFFESNGNAVRLSKAVVFRAGRLPVIGRFSLSGGHPDAADMPNTVRGLALEFSLPDGEMWRTAMINLPVFPVSTPEAFYERLLASKPDPNTGKTDQVPGTPYLVCFDVLRVIDPRLHVTRR
jgi:catalase